MKRSRQIHLVLSGALASGALAGCSRAPDGWDFEPSVSQVSTDNTYTNNHYVHGYGYYHAPYRGWYPHPFNYYLPGRGYFHGGNWTPAPFETSTTASRPAADSVQRVNASTRVASRSQSSTPSSSRGSWISRGGFGGTSHGGGSSGS
ncbi:MAG: hypothetical protein HY043_08340 [Verrucomicrobia bacterium]|nr:hypothetical protein [Verrucomicrobiota bacterium]